MRRRRFPPGPLPPPTATTGISGSVGLEVGLALGSRGETLGGLEGPPPPRRLLGLLVGAVEGADDGESVGEKDEVMDGAPVGETEGVIDGALVGETEGVIDGALVGDTEGHLLGP